MTEFRESFFAYHGYEELKRHMKQGHDFCKEVASIIQERADMELAFGKSLAKLSQRATKQTNFCLGSLCSAWTSVASHFDTEAQLHSTLGQSLKDEIYKQMKVANEEQNKSKKEIESCVEKSGKILHEKKQEHMKAKKNSHSKVKEAELLNDQVEKYQSGGKKTLSDKDMAKLQTKSQKAEEVSSKASQEYMDITVSAERARHDFEKNMRQYATQMQSLEETKLKSLQEMLNKYNSLMAHIGPKLTEACTSMGTAISRMDVPSDIRAVTAEKGTGSVVSGQMLMDCYEEDLNNSMKPNRRRASIQTKICLLGQMIDKEVKGKEGLQRLTGVYSDNPQYTSNVGMDDTILQIRQADAMVETLSACQYKLQCTIAVMERKAKPEHKLSMYITSQKDKSGLQQSVLNIPITGGGGGAVGGAQGGGDMSRPPADGAYYDDDFDPDFPSEVVCRCKALYDFVPTQKDELMINTGDIINVHEKQGDGWWLGEVRGNTGIFPESYVQEMK
ncbi:nostrin-like [Glandiceps talaboti]